MGVGVVWEWLLSVRSSERGRGDADEAGSCREFFRQPDHRTFTGGFVGLIMSVAQVPGACARTAAGQALRTIEQTEGTVVPIEPQVQL